MRRVAQRRRSTGGLLTRRPQLDGYPSPGGRSEVSPVDQLRRLVDLYDRGLVTQEELRRQQERALRLE